MKYLHVHFILEKPTVPGKHLHWIVTILNWRLINFWRSKFLKFLMIIVSPLFFNSADC